MFKNCLLAIVVSLALTSRALPCSVTGITLPHELVRQAEVIVIVRAERLSEARGHSDGLGGGHTQVLFRVLDVLKGTLLDNEIRFNGAIIDQDDPNDRPIPRDFVRPGGRRGNCFATMYRPGAEYLLLMSRAGHDAYAQPTTLTPYWAPLAPTNDQVFGTHDAWVAWVRRTLAGQRTTK